MGTEDLFVYDYEKEEEILKRAGCRDLIELMQCKNCKLCIEKEGKHFCQENSRDIELNETCSYWEERIDSINKEKLFELYSNIKQILQEFIDTKEDNYEIITLWIIGSWLHNNFPSYPYLFINAMKGSGKTRLLKIIKELSWEGEMLTSLSEAVLFRTTGTLCIDEFEDVGKKDKNALRELLNTAYKKGGKVKRMKKVKRIGLEGKWEEAQVVEEFNTFRPIVMANIKGMEEVLGDRCIDVVIEKSQNKVITRMIEDFENHVFLIKTKELLKKVGNWCSLCSLFALKNIYIDWNEYIKITTLNYTTTLTTPNYITTLFSKIRDTEIDGRNLELTFPLFLIAYELGIIDRLIEVIKKKVKEKQAEDFMEGRDVMLYDLVSRQTNEWYKIRELVNLFRQQIDFDVEEEHWLNEKWMGRALKRLNLIREKKRLGEGVEVILDIDKAKDKLKIFK